LQRFNTFNQIQKYGIFPESHIEVGNKSLEIKQKEIFPNKLSSIPLNKAFAMSKDFFFRMQQAWDDGFVHGDINRRNIFCDANGLALYDFEPYLEIIQNGRFCLMATKPYLCPNDFNNKKISKSTDEIGLSCFLNWFCFDRRTPPIKYCQKTLLPQKELMTKEILSNFL
tara:strand:- start:74 stop:580 length:507 start_codon:yes stop_codon:yes gene_type:complete